MTDDRRQVTLEAQHVTSDIYFFFLSFFAKKFGIGATNHTQNPRKNYVWQISQLCIGREVAGGGSLAVAVGNGDR